jgi:hypothetical protein
MKMSVEHWRNDTDRGEWSIGGMTLTAENGSTGEEPVAVPLSHYICYMDWLGSNPGLRNGRQATNRLSHGTDWLKAKRERERDRESE